MSDITHKVVYSGCEHDPEETSKGFCWRCRIRKLEAEVADLQTQLAIAAQYSEGDIARAEDAEAEVTRLRALHLERTKHTA